MAFDNPTAPDQNILILDAVTGPAFMSRMAYGHLVTQTNALVRERVGYYRQHQLSDRKGWSEGRAAKWRPLVREAIVKARAARAKAGV